jgi:hypothetical protein
MNSEPTRPTPTIATLILDDGDMIVVSMWGSLEDVFVSDRNLSCQVYR